MFRERKGSKRQKAVKGNSLTAVYKSNAVLVRGICSSTAVSFPSFVLTHSEQALFDTLVPEQIQDIDIERSVHNSLRP